MVRRQVGLVLVLLTMLPTLNVGLASYLAPFNQGVTGYATGMGESCAQQVGAPPLFGLWGSCNGYVSREPIPVGVHNGPVSGENHPLEDFYETTGSWTSLTGPNVGSPLHVAERARPVVVVIPLYAVEPPRGWHRVAGLLTPWVLLGGLALLVLPHRRRLDPVGAANCRPSTTNNAWRSRRSAAASTLTRWSTDESTCTPDSVTSGASE
jgi:hypothetical protein